MLLEDEKKQDIIEESLQEALDVITISASVIDGEGAPDICDRMIRLRNKLSKLLSK